MALLLLLLLLWVSFIFVEKLLFVCECMRLREYINVPPVRRCLCCTVLLWLINKNIQFRCHSIKMFMWYFLLLWLFFLLKQLCQYYHTQRLSDTYINTLMQIDNGNELFRHNTNGMNLSVGGSDRNVICVHVCVCICV